MKIKKIQPIELNVYRISSIQERKDKRIFRFEINSPRLISEKKNVFRIVLFLFLLSVSMKKLNSFCNRFPVEATSWFTKIIPYNLVLPCSRSTLVLDACIVV